MLNTGKSAAAAVVLGVGLAVASTAPVSAHYYGYGHRPFHGYGYGHYGFHPYRHYGFHRPYRYEFGPF